LYPADTSTSNLAAALGRLSSRRVGCGFVERTCRTWRMPTDIAGRRGAVTSSTGVGGVSLAAADAMAETDRIRHDSAACTPVTVVQPPPVYSTPVRRRKCQKRLRARRCRQSMRIGTGARVVQVPGPRASIGSRRTSMLSSAARLTRVTTTTACFAAARLFCVVHLNTPARGLTRFQVRSRHMCRRKPQTLETMMPHRGTCRSTPAGGTHA
jgi:hypothetical protein